MSSISTPRVDPFSVKELPRNPKSKIVAAILGCVSFLPYVVRVHDDVLGTDKEGVGQRPSTDLTVKSYSTTR